MPAGLAGVDHVVVLMLENRSFDHMLGFLYADDGNVSPTGQPFDGLTVNETNPARATSPPTISCSAPRSRPPAQPHR